MGGNGESGIGNRGPAHLPRSYAGVRALVAGASGFIGRWIARQLCAEGAEVLLAVRDESAMRDVGERYAIQGTIRVVDFGDAAAIEAVVRDARPNITFNAVGYGIDRAERDDALLDSINVHAVRDLARSVARFATPWPGMAFVHAGSALEYGDVRGDLREDVEPLPSTPYGRSKLHGTMALAGIAAETGLRAVTARLFTVYGPGEHPGRLVPSLIDGRRSGRPVSLSGGSQCRDFTYVEDAAAGMLRLGGSDAPPGWIVNLATGRLTSVREFAETAAEALGMPLEGLQFGTLSTYAGEMEHREVSVERLKSLLGWSPGTTIRDGILATWDFLSSDRELGGSTGFHSAGVK